MVEHTELENSILSSIRRIIRAVDLHSRQLAASCGFTGPQLLVLRALERLGPVSSSVLAREVSIGQATITGIIDRLERGGWVARARDTVDRRKVTVQVTPEGRRVLEHAPSLLQDRFRQELSRLEGWERTAILASLQRVATMMDAEGLAASPVLVTGTENSAVAAGTGTPVDVEESEGSEAHSEVFVEPPSAAGDSEGAMPSSVAAPGGELPRDELPGRGDAGRSASDSSAV